MVADCMNEALNSLRPTDYPFAETRLAAINTRSQLRRVPAELEGGSEEEMHYQLACAQALSRIFCWNKLQWGRTANDPEHTQEMQ